MLLQLKWQIKYECAWTTALLSSFPSQFSPFYWLGCISSYFWFKSITQPPSSFLIPVALLLFLKSRCTIKNIIKRKDLRDSTFWVAVVFRAKWMCLKHNVVRLLWFYCVMSVAPERGRRAASGLGSGLALGDWGEKEGGNQLEEPPPLTQCWSMCAP